MDEPSIEPTPEIRGPLISLLLQLYTAGGEPDKGKLPAGDDVTVPEGEQIAAITDLFRMFATYAAEVEHKHGGGYWGAVVCMARMFAYYGRETEKLGADFQEFLQRAAREPYLGDDDPSASP